MSWCELHECPDMACGGPHSVDYCPPQDETEIDWKARSEALEAQNAELKEVLKAQVVAACNGRIAALEDAAREVVNGYRPIKESHWPIGLKRLAEVLTARAAVEE